MSLADRVRAATGGGHDDRGPAAGDAPGSSASPPLQGRRGSRPDPVRQPAERRRAQTACHGDARVGTRPGRVGAARTARPAPTAPGDRRRRSRLRPDRPLPRRPERQRSHGQRAAPGLGGAQRHPPPHRHPIRRLPRMSSGSSRRSSVRLAGASTSRRRWSMPAFPTALVSMPSSIRWPSAGPSSPSGSSPSIPSPWTT